jgi:hypothetical protein
MDENQTGRQVLTAKELEAIGCEAFRGMEPSVSRLWVDWLGDQPYVRVCLWQGIDKKGLARLSRLRRYLRAVTGLEFIGVAYPVDVPWEEIHEMSRRLRDVR